MLQHFNHFQINKLILIFYLASYLLFYLNKLFVSTVTPEEYTPNNTGVVVLPEDSGNPFAFVTTCDQQKLRKIKTFTFYLKYT